MKKSTIKYLAILIIIIIIISFTGYNLETEPDNIETISQKQLYDNFTSKCSFLKYANLIHGNSKSEYVIGYYYAHALYITHGKCQVGTICIYKVGNKINFPLTGI